MRFVHAVFFFSALAASPALSATLYADQMTSGAGWTVNGTSADIAATFGYNYSADGIAEAPNTQAGDTATTGLKLEANRFDPAAAAEFWLYPVGQAFTGSYQFRFDAWMSYDADERINGGSAGTTEFLGGGVGYDNAATSFSTGVSAIATGDGGSGSDWRVFDPGFLTPAEMTAGDRNGFNAYYSDFLTGVAPPAGQTQTSFPPGVAGSPGFQWITWEFTVHDEPGLHSVQIDIEKPGGSQLRIAEVDCLVAGCGTDGNIHLYYGDLFSSVTSRPDLTFGLIDNVVVRDVPASATVPLPAGGVLLLSGLGLLSVARRRRATARTRDIAA